MCSGLLIVSGKILLLELLPSFDSISLVRNKRTGSVSSEIYLKFSFSMFGSSGIQIFPDLIIARYAVKKNALLIKKKQLRGNLI